jgi:hypothetical protein
VQQYATVTKTGTTSVLLHRAAPSLGWRAWNAYATIQALSSMKTKKANWGDKNLMAGQRRNLMKCLPGADRWGESRRRNVGKKNRGRRPQLNLKRFFST